MPLNKTQEKWTVVLNDGTTNFADMHVEADYEKLTMDARIITRHTGSNSSKEVVLRDFSYNQWVAIVSALSEAKEVIPSPKITNISPASAAINGVIAINGNNLESVTSVTIGGVPAQAFTVVNDNLINAVVGAGATGQVSVSSPYGTAVAAATFTFIPAPTITTFSPSYQQNGQTITIYGTNFTGTTAVTINGAPVDSFTVVNSGTIVATLDDNTSGDIKVTTPGGNAVAVGFEVVGTPTLTGVMPMSGAIEGDTIMLVGTSFLGTTSVSFGGVPAQSFEVIDNEHIEAVIGNGSSGDVVVTTPLGTAIIEDFIYD